MSINSKPSSLSVSTPHASWRVCRLTMRVGLRVLSTMIPRLDASCVSFHAHAKSDNDFRNVDTISTIQMSCRIENQLTFHFKSTYVKIWSKVPQKITRLKNLIFIESYCKIRKYTKKIRENNYRCNQKFN